MKLLTIGQIARQAGVGVETVRFYERQGLLAGPARPASGYRQYPEDVVARLRWWATGYNVVAVPLAAGVLYNFGILLSPAVGAVLMAASTVVVAVNARFLRMCRARASQDESKNRP